MRILLAEDERPLARALVKIFEKNNCSADAVHNGADALAYLEAGNYDVAVLDIMMPKMDGLTALKKLRAGGNQIPVLLLTAEQSAKSNGVCMSTVTNTVAKYNKGGIDAVTECGCYTARRFNLRRIFVLVVSPPPEAGGGETTANNSGVEYNTSLPKSFV